jgi:hypothetical protein
MMAAADAAGFSFSIVVALTAVRAEGELTGSSGCDSLQPERSRISNRASNPVERAGYKFQGHERVGRKRMD